MIKVGCYPQPEVRHQTKAFIPQPILSGQRYNILNATYLKRMKDLFTNF